MAPASAQYTVFGFDNRIDWKPTAFLDGIPKNRICSACGLVSATIALLPCNHPLCSRCYDGSGDEERNRRPLDTEPCKPEDVIWTSFTREKLLGRKIQCWNWRNGCNAAGPVSQVMDHFQLDCQYHAVTCFRCNQTMAYKGLTDHLKSNDCTIPQDTSERTSHGNSDASITLLAQAIGELRDKFSSMETCFHETKDLIVNQAQAFRERGAADTLVAESVQTLDNTLKESIGQGQAAAGCAAEELGLIRNSISTIMNKLCEVVVLVNEAKTSLGTSLADHEREVLSVCRDLQQKLNDLTVSLAEGSLKAEKRLDSLEEIGHKHVNHEADINDRLTCLNGSLTGEVCGKLSVLLNGSKAILQNTLNVSEPFMWTIEKWSELKKEAASKGSVVALSDSPKYFYGYCILPGIEIRKRDGDVTFHLNYHVCQGEYDLLLDWPIKKRLTIQVLGPEKTEIPQSAIVDTWLGAFSEHGMPTNARNSFVRSARYIKVADIEKKGCVQEDKVTVKFTVSRQ